MSSLEDETDACACAKRLLEEIVVHADDCIRLFEVACVEDAKSLVVILVDQSLCLPICNIEGVEAKLQADALA